MTDNTQGTVIGESTLIPYIRRQDVFFDANNLRPQKTARLFMDDIVMNGFAQKGNKIVLNSKKILTVTPNTGSSANIHTNDIVYQGSSNLSPTFSAIVDSYTSANTTLVIKSMSGNFDTSANVFVENVAAGVTTTTANITNVINSNTSDVFTMNERIFCSNNQVYMRVVGSSGENLLYVSENFINSNISAIGANNLESLAFVSGQLVYQTAAGIPNFNVAVFTARVEYYDTSTGSLALSPITGRMNANASSANVPSFLWNASNSATKPVLITGVKLSDLGANNIIISVANSAKQVTVVSHEHSSGLVANAKANLITGNANTVYLNSSNVTVAVGNMMYFTAGTGLGQFRRVTAVSGKTIVLATALSVDPTNTTKYSIGNHVVDENGSLNGIINIPEEPNFKFKTGDRVFTITDTDSLESDDYTMKTSARFASGGLRNSMHQLNMSQAATPLTPVIRPLPPTPPNNPVVPPPPTSQPATPIPPQIPVTGSSRNFVPRFRMGDPIAQTFFTPKPASNKVNYGMFVTSVDLFFGAKPSVSLGSMQLPVSVKIAEVVNGYPTKNYLASATVKAKDVKLSVSPSVSNTNSITKFVFDDPVYLQPDTEYALVIYSDSPEYEVYVAELGGNVLGADPPQRISEQPYSGSFFRSQNSSTWTAYQNEDLMFVINKAVFTGTGSAVFNIKDVPRTGMDVDRLFINADRLTFPVGSVDFKVKSIFKANSAQDNYTYIKPQQIFKYGDLMDASNKSGSANYLNTRKVVLGNSNSITVLAEFVSSDPDVSPIFNIETLGIVAGKHDINNAGVSNTIISITNRGVGYNAIVTSGNAVFGSSNNTLNNAAQLFRETYLANNFNVGFYVANVTGTFGTGADGFAVANTAGANTIEYIVINSEGYGYIETPTITVANGNAASGMVPAFLSVQGETSKRGGNIRAKYITRQISLEDGFESGDLRVFMDVVRPNGTDVEVYYKVLGSEDPDRFSDKSWVRMHKTVDRTSKDNYQKIELEFRPDLLENKLKYVENGVQYPIGGKFKFFAIKVCMTAVDSTVAPWVQNLRIIATPEG
jgi:hypothetical protein